MDDVLTMALLGLLVVGSVFMLQTYMKRDEANLCVVAKNQNFPYNASKGTIQSKYGDPESKYQQGSSTRWIYVYKESLSAGKCKIGVIFQDNKAKNYKMKEKGESGFDELFD